MDEKEKTVQQIPFRMFVEDHAVLKKMLAEDSISFQKVMDVLVQAYIQRKPAVMKMIQDYKEAVYLRKKNRYSLSAREKSEMYRALEQQRSEEDNKDATEEEE